MIPRGLLGPGLGRDGPRPKGDTLGWPEAYPITLQDADPGDLVPKYGVFDLPTRSSQGLILDKSSVFPVGLFL